MVGSSLLLKAEAFWILENVLLISCCLKDNLKCGGVLDCMVLESDSIESKKVNGSLWDSSWRLPSVSFSLPVPVLVSTGKYTSIVLFKYILWNNLAKAMSALQHELEAFSLMKIRND